MWVALASLQVSGSLDAAVCKNELKGLVSDSLRLCVASAVGPAIARLISRVLLISSGACGHGASVACLQRPLEVQKLRMFLQSTLAILMRTWTLDVLGLRVRPQVRRESIGLLVEPESVCSKDLAESTATG